MHLRFSTCTLEKYEDMMTISGAYGIARFFLPFDIYFLSFSAFR